MTGQMIWLNDPALGRVVALTRQLRAHAASHWGRAPTYEDAIVYLLDREEARMSLTNPWREVALLKGYPLLSTAVQDDETQELQRLAKGRRVLEIGSAWGYSAIAMALGGATYVTAVDPHVDGTYDAMLTSLGIYGVAHRVTIIREFSQVALPRLERDGREFDLVFIDGDHEEAAVRHDIDHCQRLLAPGGVLACHDYDNDPGIKPAFDYCCPGGPDRLVRSLAILGVPRSS